MRVPDVETYALAMVGASQGIYRYYLQPALTAQRAWLGMGLGILAYELTAPRGELLSEGTDRALEAHPVITRLGIAAVALHLLNALPQRYDPIHQTLGALKRL